MKEFALNNSFYKDWLIFCNLKAILRSDRFEHIKWAFAKDKFA